MKRASIGAAAAVLLAACVPSAGQDGKGAVAPRGSGFDFYVLALGWSPSFCRLEDPDGRSRQCAQAADLGFIVHGLWPQFERDYPESCESGEPRRVPDDIVATILDLIPSAGLIGHQWRKHGTCSGLTQGDYFATVRAAFEAVTLPAAGIDARRQSKLSPVQVERLFLDVNPGMKPTGIVVTCEGGMLEDVRICLTRDLTVRECPRVDARACNSPVLTVPAAP